MKKLTKKEIEKVYFILSRLLDLGTHYEIKGIIDNQNDWSEINDLREKFKQ
jgi:hypothetical protein